MIRRHKFDKDSLSQVALSAEGTASLRLRMCAVGGMEDVGRRKELDQELKELLCSEVDTPQVRRLKGSIQSVFQWKSIW